MPETPQSKTPLTLSSNMSSVTQMSVNATPTGRQMVKLAYVSVKKSEVWDGNGKSC